MDSGNSGSMQSSSGGDEEYDSRSESAISSFLNPSAHFGSIADPQASSVHPQLSHQTPTSTLFNIPHSQTNLDVFPQTTLANNNRELVWSRGLRSEPNYPNFGNLTASSSSSSSSSSQSALFGSFQGLTTQSPSILPSQGTQTTTRDASKTDHHQQPIVNVPKNPKKRTRASRRAPTTVLTTDTTNFRQMVQEFTGIPAAPFSASASPYSRRLDHIFSSGGPLANSLSPLYPLRPSAQKMVQLSPFGPSSNTMMNALISSTTTNTSNTAVLPSHDLGLLKQPQNLFSMQNQQMLQANTTTTTSLPSFDELGLGHQAHQNVNVQENLGGSSVNQHISNYKFNCSASTSEFHHDKGLENVTSAGEGTVGSWICPSD